MNLWQTLLSLAVTSLSSFGNGTVMAAVLQRSFVQQAHVLTNDELLFAFALARVTPGQQNLYIASVGYMLFGWPGAILSVVTLQAPSYLMLPLLRSYQHFQDRQAVRGFTRGLAASAAGILIAASWSLSKDAFNVPITWAPFAVALGLMLFTRLPVIISQAIAMACGIGLVFLTGAAG